MGWARAAEAGDGDAGWVRAPDADVGEPVRARAPEADDRDGDATMLCPIAAAMRIAASVAMATPAHRGRVTTSGAGGAG